MMEEIIILREVPKLTFRYGIRGPKKPFIHIKHVFVTYVEYDMSGGSGTSCSATFIFPTGIHTLHNSLYMSNENGKEEFLNSIFPPLVHLSNGTSFFQD